MSAVFKLFKKNTRGVETPPLNCDRGINAKVKHQLCTKHYKVEHINVKKSFSLTQNIRTS